MENSSELDLLVARIVDANPAQRSGYQEGKLDLMNWFLGQVMKETRGKADPARAREILADKLGQP
jgi:aspartyl-tRNA(Asn)/glutamyl-tRNA(Gln) amidotransferase subunit B